MKIKIRAIFLIILFSSFSVNGEDRIVVGGMDGLDPNDFTENYSVLLALSGGGARGLSVIGILKAFEEKNIHIRAVAGTSIGGIIGGLYASGYTPDQLDSIASELDFSNLFSNSPSRKSMFLTQRQSRGRYLLSLRFKGFRPIIPKALTAGQKLTSILTDLTNKVNYHSGLNFSRLP
ncbi:MAG: patatin-like phospholipase family protein, partial [Candidatus Zixiibacteriota bacterium]